MEETQALHFDDGPDEASELEEPWVFRTPYILLKLCIPGKLGSQTCLCACSSDASLVNTMSPSPL